MERRSSGRSVSLPALLALALVTGAFALLAPRMIGTSSDPTIAAGRTASERATQRFYDAVNQALATGDARNLHAILATDYLDHEARPGLEPNAEGLVRYVLDGSQVKEEASGVKGVEAGIMGDLCRRAGCPGPAHPGAPPCPNPAVPPPCRAITPVPALRPPPPAPNSTPTWPS